MDKAYLSFRDMLVRSIIDAKLEYVRQGRSVTSTDPVIANQIASGLTVIAYRREPIVSRGPIDLWFDGTY